MKGLGEKRPTKEDGEVLKEAKKIRSTEGLVVNVKVECVYYGLIPDL